MPTSDYRTAMDAAVKEYETLGAQRRAIDARLAELTQTIGTLGRLLGLVPTVPLGLTEACRLILRSGQSVTPLDVRDRLAAMGFDLSVYANVMAAIHTTLKRLTATGEVRQVTGATGKVTYWSEPPGASTLVQPKAAAPAKRRAASPASARRRR